SLWSKPNITPGPVFGGQVNIWGMIIPFPQGVTLNAEQAEVKAARMIMFWHWHTAQTVPDGMVLRTYLITSNEYKRRIESTNMAIFVRRLYRGKPMPRWLWVTEISSIGSYNSASLSQWLISGEVLIDATSNPWTLDFVALHHIDQSLQGYVATMRPDHNDADEALQWVWDIGDDQPYRGVMPQPSSGRGGLG
ncbi:MAG: hypothetical protein QGI09_10935, partial [Dehalococcoidia bacterium]|nr:hypothetical protein [Dehalococcoidia bacterium]